MSTRKTAVPQGIPSTGLCSERREGCQRDRGELTPDPYASDINDRTVWRYLCPHCCARIALGI